MCANAILGFQIVQGCERIRVQLDELRSSIRLADDTRNMEARTKELMDELEREINRIPDMRAELDRSGTGIRCVSFVCVRWCWCSDRGACAGLRC
jgi:hypothetical protein